MKLTRKQELALIDLGFEKLLERLSRKPAKSTRKWTAAQRQKHAETMKKKWGNRKLPNK